MSRERRNKTAVWAVMAIGLLSGCDWTSRPMLPETPDGAFTTVTDAATGLSGDAPGADSAGPPGVADSCRATPSATGGDGGFRDEQGNPCDPAAPTRNDAGADGAVDAADGDGAVGDVPEGDTPDGDVTDAADARADVAADGPDALGDGTDRAEVTVGEGLR